MRALPAYVPERAEGRHVDRRQQPARRRALLESYHRIDDQQTSAGLWIEARSATQWMSVATGDDIAANRAAVIERGRTQVR